jgi:hypothetical protein
MKMRNRSILFTAILVCLSFQASAESSLTIEGSWRLISSEGHGADGRVVYDQGKHPVGRVMFDASGRMSIHLTNPDRSNFASGDFLRPTQEECLEAFKSYFGYFGSYTLDEKVG